MPQVAADAAAEVQADTAGLPVGAAVAAGVAAVEDAGQILRRDADTGVADAEGGRGLRVDGDAAALRRVFQGVGQYLLHHEAQPLLVCHHRQMQRLIVQGELTVDELPREFSQALADDAVQIAGADHIVAGPLVQAQVHQHHVHVLLDTQQLAHEPAGIGGVVRLEGQAHGGDGGLDLMDPGGVVVHHLPITGGVGRLPLRCGAAQGSDGGHAVALPNGGGFRQVHELGVSRRLELRELPVAAEGTGIVPDCGGQTQQQAQ